MIEREHDAVEDAPPSAPPSPSGAGEPDRRVLGVAIRGRRRQLDLTLAAVGRRSGLSIGFLSQVERGLASPSPAALCGIARALGVAPDYFAAAPNGCDVATRADSRRPVAPDGTVRYERLSTDLPGQLLSAVLVELPPGFRSEAASHDGEELVFVLEGSVTISVDGRATRLGRGDSLHFRAGLPHAWTNAGSQPARLLWTGTDRVFPPAHCAEGAAPGAATSGQHHRAA